MWLDMSTPCKLTQSSCPSLRASPYLCQGKSVRVTAPVCSRPRDGLHQVQALKVKPELADVGVDGNDSVGGGPGGGIAVRVSRAPDVGAVVDYLVVRLEGVLDDVAADSYPTGAGGTGGASSGLTLLGRVTLTQRPVQTGNTLGVPE